MFGCQNASIEEQYHDYALNIIYDDSQKTLECQQSINYINKSDSYLDYLCFHLYPSAFREQSKQSVISLLNHTICYYKGTSYGSITIKKVSHNNNDLNFEITGEDENILKVPIPNLMPGERVQISIEFDVVLPNINHRFGYGENTINVANFYPIVCIYENGEFVTNPYHSNGDPFYSQIANYNVNITYPSNLKTAHTGKLIESKEYDNESLPEQKMTTIKVQANKVRDFAFVMSEKFEIISQKTNNTQIDYYYYGDKNPQTSLQTAVDALNTFNELFMPYPYETLSVVETNFVHGGMEYPNLVYIADSIADYSDYQNVIIHEIAHQWWYNIVGSNAFSNGWQDEGLTDYSTALFYQKNPHYERNLDTIILNGIRNYAFFVEVYSSVYGNLDTSMNRALNEYPTDPEYVYIAYVKSMLMFDSLRSLIGDKDFFDALQMYCKTYSFKEATPEEMIACFEKTTNKKLDTFFNSWLEGKVLIISPN